MTARSALNAFLILALAALGAASLAAPQARAQDPGEEDPWGPLTVLSRTDIAPDTGYAALGLTGENKPNGRIYRLRQSQAPGLPAFVPQVLDNQALVIADRVNRTDPGGPGWLCLYKGPYPEGDANCRYTALLVSDDNELRWKLDMNALLSADEFLEIQDIRYADNGLLYFNEACQSYSRRANGACSALVCVSPQDGRVLWRSADLISNNILIVYGNVVICGYGFTGESDYLHLVDADTGQPLSVTELDSAHDYLEIRGNTLQVTTYKSLYAFELPAALR